MTYGRHFNLRWQLVVDVLHYLLQTVLEIGFIKHMLQQTMEKMIFIQQYYTGHYTLSVIKNGLMKQQEIFLVEELHKNMNVILTLLVKLLFIQIILIKLNSCVAKQNTKQLLIGIFGFGRKQCKIRNTYWWVTLPEVTVMITQCSMFSKQIQWNR